jgi:pilus assembly protein CpaB
MRLGSILMTVVGLGVAGGAVLVAQSQLSVSSADASASGVVKVVAAAQDIPFGSTIEGHMLTSIRWPVDAVPPGVFTDLANVLPSTGTEPRRAKRALAQGELLLVSKVSGFGEKVTIVQTLGENSRAMAINVDAGSGVGGFVTPGDFVDVVLTQGRNETLRAVTVLQNVRVVGVDQTSDEQAEQAGVARTVTVEITPEQGQKLALAQQAGKLSLSLRSLDTTEDKPLAAVRLSDIMTDQSPTADDKPRPVIRVRRAATEVEEVPVR